MEKTGVFFQKLNKGAARFIQDTQQVKFERNPLIKFIDNRCHP